MIRRVRTFATILAIAALVVWPAIPAAHAGIGVGTDTGKITVKDAMATGGSYTLPSFKILNSGDVAIGYVLKSVAVTGALSPDPSWFTFSPDAMFLSPGQAKAITVQVDIPADAEPGTYRALLVGEPTDPTEQASGARVNIGAGPRLEMQVVSANPVRMAWSRASSWFTGGMPWTVALPLVLAFVLVGGALTWRRRSKRAPITGDESGGDPGSDS